MEKDLINMIKRFTFNKKSEEQKPFTFGAKSHLETPKTKKEPDLEEKIAKRVINMLPIPKNGKDATMQTAQQIADKLNTLVGALDVHVIKGDRPNSVKNLVAEMKRLPVEERLDISDIRNWNQPARGKLDQRWHGSGSGSSGGISSISIASANGISGSSSGGTTPILTLALGAITPTSIVSLGTISGSNLTGTNTGDNAVNSLYSGLAASKQDTLISGTNIKTINSNSLLGSGDLVISSGGTPGGSDTNIQYNSSGSFGGDARFSISFAFDSPSLTLGDGTANDVSIISLNTTGLFLISEGTLALSAVSNMTIDVDTNGTGNSLVININDAASGNVTGGGFTVSSADGHGSGAGGAISLTSGRGGLTSGVGGNLSAFAGNARAGNSNGGNVYIVSGAKNGSGTDGTINLQTGNSGSIYAILDTSSLASSSKTFTFPNASGTFAVSASGNIALSATGNLTFTGQLPIANGGTGATTLLGAGIPGIVGNDRKTGQTAGVNLATYTVGASDASFIVSANILVTTSTLYSISATVSYTDEGNTSRVLTLNFSQLTGVFVTTITNALAAPVYEGVPLHIRCKAGTTIVIGTTGTFTTITYNFEERIILE